MMQLEAVQQTLAKLEATDFFSAVGKPIDADVLRASSWAEACKFADSHEWDFKTNEATNEVGEAILMISKERLNQWSEVLGVVRPLVIKLLSDKQISDGKYPLTEGAVVTIRWCLLGLCMEAAYSDILTPRFFTEISEWFYQGHFPCGWQGDLYAGKLVVY